MSKWLITNLTNLDYGSLTPFQQTTVTVQLMMAIVIVMLIFK